MIVYVYVQWTENAENVGIRIRKETKISSNVKTEEEDEEEGKEKERTLRDRVNPTNLE